MTRLVPVLLVALLAPAGAWPDARAQSAEDALRARLESKLASPFLERAPWRLDYESALADAEASGRPVFAYFTRSYAP